MPQLRGLLRVHAVRRRLPGRGHRPHHDSRNQRGAGGGRDPVAGISGLQSRQVRDLPLLQSAQRGDRPGVRAHSLGLRALRRPPGPALGPRRAQEDRLAPVRRLPGCEIPHLLLLGLLHVRHQGGGDRQGARAYPLDTAIFFMDMRTFGKDFELYYNRAKDEHGVRFIRSRIHSIDPLPDGDLAIRFADESGVEKTETFNLVVLSVGMEVSQGARELNATLKVETNGHDFVATSPFAPVTASRPGIYVCGAMQGPKDIPESVMQASAAAGAVSASLGDVRWTETKTRQAVTPKDIKPKTPPASGCSSATAASTSAASSTCRRCRNTPRRCPTWRTWKTTCSPAPRTPRST